LTSKGCIEKKKMQFAELRGPQPECLILRQSKTSEKRTAPE